MVVEKQTARMEAISDGVFAIAITLLVLELHVPEPEHINSNNSLMLALRQNRYSYVSFAISFFSIFIMWVNHHKIFKQIYHRNNAITFINGFILFLASSISFTTALLSRFYGTPAATGATAVYTGLFVLINISFNLLWHVASRDKSLLRPDITDTAITRIRRTYLAGLPVHTLAFILAFYYPPPALILCVSLWIFWAAISGKVRL